MCRLLAISSNEYVLPEKAISGLCVMQEGFDGSGFGMLLRDLGGPFEKMKSVPILSGIFSRSGLSHLNEIMLDLGFSPKYKVNMRPRSMAPEGIPKRDMYLVCAFDYPSAWEDWSQEDRLEELTRVRMEIQKQGREAEDMMVFSFWPDTVVIKELGEALFLAKYLDLNRSELMAKIIMVQGEQNTGCRQDVNTCCPSFLQGYATMANGENAAAAINREFLSSRDFFGYNGDGSSGAVFTHALHYVIAGLDLGLDGYKHVLTPLTNGQLADHPNGQILGHLKNSCRKLAIDGPNCIIGCLPDNTMFMVQDRHKMQPGVVGNDNGMYVFSSEISGLDAVLPNRDSRRDFQPMHMDVALVKPGRDGVGILSQTQPLEIYFN